MYHKHDTQWKEEEEINKIIRSPFPTNFHKVMAQHYKERVVQVIQKGLQHSKLYFFVRDQMKYHEKNGKA